MGMRTASARDKAAHARAQLARYACVRELRLGTDVGSAVKGTRLYLVLVTAENNRTVPSARGLRGAE